MANLRTEPIPYEKRDRVLGLELDDGTFLENFRTEIQIDNGTPFILELYPYSPHGGKEYDAFGNGELVEITPDDIQRFFDEERVTIITEN